MPYDFETYLSKLDPTQCYTVQDFKGGVSNFSARATKKDASAKDLGRFPEHKSLVLKHAPPYVAVVGANAPLAQTRQAIEAKVLAMFDQGSLLAHVPHEAGVYVPELLHRDQENHVIVLSDLGPLMTLADAFSGLGGWVAGGQPPSTFVSLRQHQDMKGPKEHNQHFASIGLRLGTFFAHLHSKLVFNRIIEDPQMGPSYLENPSIRESVIEFSVKPIRTHLARFADLINSPYVVDQLYQRIKRDQLRPQLYEERSLIIGDCWSGNVLVSSLPSLHAPSPSALLRTATPSNPTVCMVDFEFASLSRGSIGDISQFIAHLECFLIVARHRKDPINISNLERLISCLIGSYKSTSRELNAPWLPISSRERGHSIPEPPQTNSLSALVLRTCLLSMAAEIMNVIFWKVWPCGNTECPGISMKESAEQPTARDWDGAHDESKIHLCPLIRQLASASIWLIQRAGENEVEMCEEQNWKLLVAGLDNRSGSQDVEDDVEGDSRRIWIIDLFI